MNKVWNSKSSGRSKREETRAKKGGQAGDGEKGSERENSREEKGENKKREAINNRREKAL